ncbi:hypothetical protein Pmani_018424 [Petrolisthes manimaculis]|uniref:Uncharacterized protein n=1 Tax=Petrolisthes manimaculis TaxID=1843537 RepID=A0AAE1PMQ1_9EUCA|nr:hypothetical protein Pmani_018424 [Petrolisthes manimaculis]
MRSGHTLGNTFGRVAEPGEGSRQVLNPRRVRDLLILACEDCSGGQGGGNHLIDSTAWKAVQQRTVECEGNDRARKKSWPSTAAKEVPSRNNFLCHWTLTSAAERLGLFQCKSFSTVI